MPWHAEVLALTLRRFVPGESYDARDKFASVATAQVLNGAWHLVIDSERHGEDKSYDTSPSP